MSLEADSSDAPRIEASRETPVDGASIEVVPVAQFVEAVAAMRTSTPVQRAAHFERLSNTPLATHAVVARIDGRSIACGQVALDGGLAGIYDMVTAADFRGRGLATAIVTVLSNWALRCGASHAYVQVNATIGGARRLSQVRIRDAYTYH